MTPGRTTPAPARPVLVAVGTDHWESAVRHGAAAAVRTSSPLHLLRVVDLTPGGGLRDRPFAPAAVHAAEAVLWEAVVYARALVGESSHVSSELAHGEVVGRILAASEVAALAVLQRRPRTTRPGLGRDVCAQVAARAPVPLVSVPEGWNGAPGRGTVTVGVDDPLTCEPLLRQAARAASDCGARLVVLHAEWGSVTAGEPGRYRILEQLAAAVGEQAAVATTVKVVVADAATALLEAAHDCELLVVGRHHPHQTGGSRLGPVARRVVRYAACPVLLPNPSDSVSSAEWVFETRWA